MREENKSGESQAAPVYAGQRGVTLVELAVVLFMLLMIIIPMSAAIQRSLSTSNDIYRFASCAFLAEQKMEEIRMKASCYTASPNNCPNVPNDQAFHPIAQADYTETAPACAFPAPFTDFKCDVVWLQSTVEGGGVKKYFRDIQVRVWFDADSDNTWDAEEPDVLLQTGLTPHSPTGPSG